MDFNEQSSAHRGRTYETIETASNFEHPPPDMQTRGAKYEHPCHRAAANCTTKERLRCVRFVSIRTQDRLTWQPREHSLIAGESNPISGVLDRSPEASKP